MDRGDKLARETAVGQLIVVHSQRLSSLARLHSTLAWISEGGGPRKSLTYMERVALMTWHPIGTIVVRGIEFRGMIETTGLDLPFCRQVADDMMSTKVKGVPIRQADAEVREAMKAENAALAALQAQVDRMTSAESCRRRLSRWGRPRHSPLGSWRALVGVDVAG
jgi:hypothetical protein